MSTPKGYVDSNYLQAAAKLLQQTKQRSYTYMQIQSGHKVLDVGCGSGTDTIPLAHLVGSTGYVAGVDYDDAMVSEANRHAKEARVSAWVTHKRADATSLPFASGEFDSSRSERLFQHLLNPEKALSEMVRVTKLGGWVVVLDTDWGTLSTDTSEIDIERRIVRVHTERCLHNGYSGRRLYRLFKRETLVDISIEMFPTFVTNYALGRQMLRLDETEQEALAADIITSDELQRWRDSLECAEAEGVFFGTVSMVLVAGRKT
jgi:ubiquinone/menaquinone biosynthesis C-methylase UbiE